MATYAGTVFGSLDWSKLIVLLLIGLVVVGPEKLPTLASDAARTLRKLRVMVKGLTDDLKSELGPEVGDLDLASLHPRTFVQKHLFGDDDPLPERPRVRPLLAGEPAPWDPDTT
ncbi:MAG: sec-independent translocase [Actinomycetota bacterium]|nr:sec-independent translocase [Actinomycetota bacterium]